MYDDLAVDLTPFEMWLWDYYGDVAYWDFVYDFIPDDFFAESDAELERKQAELPGFPSWCMIAKPRSPR